MPVEEVPVLQGGTAPGERLSPTQPFSTGMPSFSGPKLREADMWGVTPIDQMVCRIEFAGSRYEGTLTPHTLDKPTIVQPGDAGGVDWGSVSVDADRGIMVVNWMRLPTRDTLITRAEADHRGFKPFDGVGPVNGGDMPMEKTPYAGVGEHFLGPLGTPCAPPPWGLIGAVDLASGKVICSEPLGSAERSGPLGIPSHLPLTIGVPFSGGTLTTRGCLVLTAGTVDQNIRAFDAATGRELWKAGLPAGGQATPITHRAKSGRQFVLIAAGGKPSLKTTHGTGIVAYALPR